MISQTQIKNQVPRHNMEVPMVINSCSKMTGELFLTTDTRVEGKVFGKVDSDRNVIIGTSGYVKGFLRAKNLVIFGRIEGTIIVTGTTIMHPGSSIFGNLYTNLLEVREGAVITAHVNTYVEMKAFDEAQLFLAEEMFRLQQNQITTSAYSKKDNTFDDNLEIVENDQSIDNLTDTEEASFSEQKEVLWNEVLNNDTKQSEQSVILNPDEQSPNSFNDSLKKESDAAVPLSKKLEKDPIIQAETSISIHAMFFQEAPTKDVITDQLSSSSKLDEIESTLQIDDTILEPFSNNAIETQTVEVDNEIFAPDEVADSEPISRYEAAPVVEKLLEVDDIARTEASIVSEHKVAIKSIEIPEQFHVQPVQEIAKTTLNNKRVTFASNSAIKSAIFSSLLEHSEQEGIISDGCELKPEIPDTIQSSPAKQKNLSHSILNLGEIGNLFNRTKNSNKNPDEEINVQTKGVTSDKIDNQLILNDKSAKDNEENSNPKTNGNKSDESFLTKSIKELPTSDFSKLFS